MKRILLTAAFAVSPLVAVPVMAQECCAVSAVSLIATENLTWSSFLTAEQVKDVLDEPGVVVVDVRSADEYAVGHIPGAISLPGDDWRTAKAKPGEGDSQYLFRTADGSVDIARYEALLSKAGIGNDDRVIIYGNHAGKGDGSVPAMILDILGHRDVAFLNGVGMSEWHRAGFEVSSEPTTRPATTFVAADAHPEKIWNLTDVVTAIGDDHIVFLDTRSPEEFVGDAATLAKRGNARGGHIPGAVLLNYADEMDENKRVVDPAMVKQQLEERGVTPDKTVVLYCQTATRVSLPYLALRDLGYKHVVVYDASWHEYGNRPDTPIEGETAAQ